MDQRTDQHRAVERPNGIAEHLEQLRAPIIKSNGLTDTERHLAALAESTFLNLWSYPNPYREQRINGSDKGDGKELCDLLVICDPHVLIFSEKNIRWQEKPIEIAWPRWYRSAIDDAAKQLRGAERWIDSFPAKIFVDKACTVPLPLSFPPLERRRVHRIVVANGAAAACKTFFNGGTGSLVIMPELKGQDHVDMAEGNVGTVPFAIGDIDPDRDFVHVLDEATLGVVLGELDTITDLTGYLDRRADFIRSGNLALAHGEEDLLAYYSVRADSDGQHHFSPPGKGTWAFHGPLRLDGSHYSGLISDPRYLAKKEADMVSYAWDALIEQFTGHLLDGTSLVPPGQDYSLIRSEQAFRAMAQEPRVARRNLGNAFLDACRRGMERQIFFRVVVSPMEHPVGTAYFFMTLKFEEGMFREGYEQYRIVRSGYLELYAKALLMRNPDLIKIIGIGREPPGQGRGVSEDCIYAEQDEWSAEDRTEIELRCSEVGIMQSLTGRRYHIDEYPKAGKRPQPAYSGVNRAERRRMAATLKKRR